MNSDWDKFDLALDALEQNQAKKAFSLLSQLVKKGFIPALHNLAYCYSEGKGVKKNVKKALNLYRKSFRLSKDSGSAYNLGVEYRSMGHLRLAISWFEKARNSGDIDAAVEIAKIYLVGFARPNHTAAQKYLSIALLKENRKNISEDSYEDALTLSKELKKTSI